MSFIIYFLQQNIFLRNKRSKWLLCRCILRTVKKAYFPKSKHVRKTYKKKEKVILNRKETRIWLTSQKAPFIPEWKI